MTGFWVLTTTCRIVNRYRSAAFILRVIRCLPEPNSVILNTKATRSSGTSLSFTILHAVTQTAISVAPTVKSRDLFIIALLRIFVSPPSSVEVRNERSYTFTPLVCLHDVYR